MPPPDRQDLDDLIAARGRLKSAERLVRIWDHRHEEAVKMKAQVHSEKTQADAAIKSLEARFGMPPTT